VHYPKANWFKVQFHRFGIFAFWRAFYFIAMAITKKIRFEVFKRDGFTCQYCGKHPPETTLEIDHIKPKSKNGSDDINNLITSCFDCNRGKSNIELKIIPNSLNENKEILIEREKQYIEYHKLLAKINKRVNLEIEDICQVYYSYFPGSTPTELFKKETIKKFIDKLNHFVVKDAMEISCSKLQNSKKQYINNRWVESGELALKYFCGICWNKTRDNGI
jgi:hypothetical protein